jgi:hypothetical protein
MDGRLIDTRCNADRWSWLVLAVIRGSLVRPYVDSAFRWVRLGFMASEPVRDARRTAETMHDTAEALERAEQTLHRSADASPDDATAGRLDRLGDAVTAEARDIDRRADNLSARTPPKDPAEQTPR